jgi:hypothetical protein
MVPEFMPVGELDATDPHVHHTRLAPSSPKKPNSKGKQVRVKEEKVEKRKKKVWGKMIRIMET